MRKTLLALIVISGLIFAGISIAALVKLVRQKKATANQQTVTKSPGVSVSTVLHAHGLDQNKVRWSFRQNATLAYYEDTPTGPQLVVERKLAFSTDGSLIRFDKTTLKRTQSFLFNGQTIVQTISEEGTQLGATVLNDFDAARIKFQIASFGLLPVLKRLSNPSTQVVYLRATSNGAQFLIKTARGPRYLYVDSKNLIYQFEVDDFTITYGDYRTVDGMNLPFYQQVKKGDKLIYDIKFDAVDFNPVFASAFFKSSLL